MFTDMFGNDRLKVGLHMHTTRSDGKKTPEEAAAVYAAAGFDAIAITDHWKWTPSGTLGGLRVISGAEYNVGGSDPCVGIGIYHILALGCANEPAVSEDQSPAEIAGAIHAEGGIAVLAHPGWSLNDPSSRDRPFSTRPRSSTPCPALIRPSAPNPKRSAICSPAAG